MAPNFGDAPSKNLFEVMTCFAPSQLNSLSAPMCYSCRCHFCTSVVKNMGTKTIIKDDGGIQWFGHDCSQNAHSSERTRHMAIIVSTGCWHLAIILKPDQFQRNRTYQILPSTF